MEFLAQLTQNRLEYEARQQERQRQRQEEREQEYRNPPPELYSRELLEYYDYLRPAADDEYEVDANHEYEVDANHVHKLFRDFLERKVEYLKIIIA
jgi:hypothetical protein